MLSSLKFLKIPMYILASDFEEQTPTVTFFKDKVTSDKINFSDNMPG